VKVIIEQLQLKNIKLALDEMGPQEKALIRKKLTFFLSDNFSSFNNLRRHLINNYPPHFHVQNKKEQSILDILMGYKVIEKHDAHNYKIQDMNDVEIYLKGAWLEELAWHAILQAGADAATFGQQLYWNSGGFSGQNEIDVIARKGEKLIFISCKTRPPLPLDRNRANYRKDFKHNLAEADNYQDHFGKEGDIVILLNTRDLFDEYNGGQSRYEDIMGKAHALDVQLIGLEDLPYDRLVSRFKKILNNSE